MSPRRESSKTIGARRSSGERNSVEIDEARGCELQMREKGLKHRQTLNDSEKKKLDEQKEMVCNHVLVQSIAFHFWNDMKFGHKCSLVSKAILGF